MTDSIITIKQLGKLYDLSGHNRPDTLRDVLVNLPKKKRPQDLFWALKEINFVVQPGEIVGIIGKNGSGKSTLLKLLAQITPPTQGKITLWGRVASLLEIGTGFHPELTGRENIYLNGAILGMTRTEIKHKFNNIIQFADIDKFLDTPTKHYSSGMRVRLAFAVAAHLEPEILLIDEVLAVGDNEFQKKCLGKIDSISKEGRTILFVSHDMQTIRSLCSRVIVLDRGKITFDGDVNAAIGHYESSYIKDVAVMDWGDKGPTTASAQLIKAGILSDGKPSGPEFSIGKPLQIYITFKAKIAAKIGATIRVYNQEDQLLFSSSSNLRPDTHAHMAEAGFHTNTCTIPANLFSPGKYSVSIGLWEELNKVGIMERDVLHIVARADRMIQDTISPAFDYGLICPALTWSSEFDKNKFS